MTVGEIIQQIKAQLEEFTEAIRNAESETDEEAWYMLDSALHDMDASIGENKLYGNSSGWIYELYRIKP